MWVREISDCAKTATLPRCPVGQSTQRLEKGDPAVVKLLSHAADLINDPVDFGRRVPPALNQRWHKRWDPIARSELSRAASGRSVWRARSLRRRIAAAPPRNRSCSALRMHTRRGSQSSVVCGGGCEISAGAVRIRFVNSWTTTDNPREETSTVAGVTRDAPTSAGPDARLRLPRRPEPLPTAGAVSPRGLRDARRRLPRRGRAGDALAALPLGSPARRAPRPQRKPFAFARRLVCRATSWREAPASTSRSWPRPPTGTPRRGGRPLRPADRFTTRRAYRRPRSADRGARRLRSPRFDHLQRQPLAATIAIFASRKRTGGSCERARSSPRGSSTNACARPRSPRDQSNEISTPCLTASTPSSPTKLPRRHALAVSLHTSLQASLTLPPLNIPPTITSYPTPPLTLTPTPLIPHQAHHFKKASGGHW